ncbi:MAG: DNA-binding response regulator [Caulobacteraceae bacterium]|nr:DNA-binding response regulator [Caulobacteraceae bacterium]
MIPELHRDLAVEPAKAVLVVEDDPALRALLIRSLKENGFEVHSAGSGVQMAAVLADTPVDLVLLDVMLPGPNGFDLCRDIRRVSEVPIIMLSARGDESDRLVGLELGADDYMSKPFSTKELVARIRANLRRAGGKVITTAARRRRMVFAGWTLDAGARELTSPEGVAVDLSGAEFDLLLAFVGSPQRVIGRERLLELSRARVADASDRSVDVLVSRLRRKLSSASNVEPLIRTVRGVGYSLTAAVERE